MAKSPLAANMLAYMRSLQISEAVMSGLTSLDAKESIPIEVLEKGVRGQSSQYNANPDEVTATESKAGGSNLQVVDYAMLPEGCEWLEIRFSLLVLPNSLKPSATDTPEAGKALASLVNDYANAEGFKELAERYVGNIANGRFAWRNRFMTDEARVKIEWSGGELAFDPLGFDLGEVPTREKIAKCLIEGDRDKLDALIADFTRGLSEKSEAFEVRWLSKLPARSEVFPSQEYVRSDSEKGKGDKNKVSRVYASIPWPRNRDVRWAVMHSQKIGAALRCIDDWHGSIHYPAPVPVNPFAGVQEANIALRAGKRGAPRSYYDINRNPQQMIDALARGKLTSDAHFFVANLVRGGVLGDPDALKGGKSK